MLQKTPLGGGNGGDGGRRLAGYIVLAFLVVILALLIWVW